MYNPNIEKSVLGCLIINNDLIKTASQDITPKHFYTYAYQKLFEEIVQCYTTKGVADITVLKTVDVDTLVDIMNFVPTVSNWDMYKKELVNLSTKRELLQSIEDIKNKIGDEKADIETLKLEALGSINNIKVDAGISEESNIKDILCQSLNFLESKHNGNLSYRNWGIKWLDEKTGGVKPALTYLAARPSVGKTALALQISKNIAKQGAKVAIFSLEMDKVSICNRLICNAGNISKSVFDRPGSVADEVWVEISRLTGEISSLPIHIYDKQFNIEDILLKAEEQRTKSGLDFLVLDYIQLCESRQKFGSPNERISYISRQLKKYQQQTGIHVLALSQFNRETESKKFPTLSNLRDSGSLEQDGNNVFFLHEEYVEPEQAKAQSKKELLLIIAKQREGERNICTKLDFYGVTQRFYEQYY